MWIQISEPVTQLLNRIKTILPAIFIILALSLPSTERQINKFQNLRTPTSSQDIKKGEKARPGK